MTRKGSKYPSPEDRIPDDGYKSRGSRTRCPYCKKGKVCIREKRTIPSKDADFRKDYSRRRRLCLNCNAKWTTVEIHASVWKLIRKIIEEADKISASKAKDETQKPK